MIAKAALAIGISIALAGCAAPNFRRSTGNEGASNADFDRSQYECNLQVRQASQGRFVSGGLLFIGIVSAANAASDRQLYTQCMSAHGFTAIDSPNNPPAPIPTLVTTAPAAAPVAAPVQIPPPQAILPPSIPPGAVNPMPVTASQLPPPAGKIVAVAIQGESKYQFSAEQYAKARGCTQPVAAMVVRQSFNETFSIDCQGRETMMVRCEGGACRGME